MKRFFCIQFLCLVFLFSLMSTSALAIGLGLYGSVGSGNAEWEADNGNSWDFDTDATHSGFGFLLDTAVSRNVLFNYRINIGYEKVTHKLDSNGDLNLDSFVIDQDFGFGVVRTKEVRLWLGPEMRLSYSTGSPDDYSDFDIKLVGLGVGPVIGMNFNIGEVVSLSLKGGYLFTSYSGTGEDSSGYNSNVDYKINETSPFINFAVIFRINDTY